MPHHFKDREISRGRYFPLDQLEDMLGGRRRDEGGARMPHFGGRSRAASEPSGPLVNVIRIEGKIAPTAGLPVPGVVSMDSLRDQIREAFNGSAQAVALKINSGGGSPVQSRQIFEEIRHYADKTGKPVLSFIEDAGCSGAYMIALAGDKIFADPDSLVGSVGAVMMGFDYSEHLRKEGVKPIVRTSGRNKAQGNGLMPESDEAAARSQDMLNQVHANFRGMVEARRGHLLKKGSDAVLTDSDVLTGTEALRLGFIDGLGNMGPVLRKIFGSEVNARPVETAPVLSMGGGLPMMIPA